MLWKGIIKGRPVPKKNNPQIILTPRKNAPKGIPRNQLYKFVQPYAVPSKTYKKYEKQAMKQIEPPQEPIAEPCRLVARYYLPDRRWWPDLVGLLQGTGDLLEEAQVIADDKYIRSFDGSRIVELDKENPRAELEIYPAEDGR